jgi:HAD superfamily phosphatase
MKTEPKRAIVVFDIDGVVRDVSGSYRRAIADTVEKFTNGSYRPTMADIDELKTEGIWNNDWQASQELVYRYYESQGTAREKVSISYETIIDFFQKRYRGENPDDFDGYIASEPLLMSASYLKHLRQNNIGWGFFSGATRGSAQYILQKRLGLQQPVLVAMEDAPGKPNPTGLFEAVRQITKQPVSTIPVLYVGDTVADMQTVIAAKKARVNTKWIGIGVLPPHVQTNIQQQEKYRENLQQAGAAIVLKNVEELNFDLIASLI